ncbi:MAG TPA: hypothetical protein VER08_11980 [Pyrinomonadaceae bacterium]|nr:hypothetical protein [Pyrinomonadaceae bacterium]
MRELSLVLGAALRDRARWAREHLYAILILSPLVVGMTYVTAARVATYAPEGVALTATTVVALATLAAAAVASLSLSRVSAEVYHLRRPESLHDALPVGKSTHLHAALLTRAARTAAVGAVALVARTLAGDRLGSDVVAPVALFVVVLALAEVLAALEWVHWGHRREWGQALAGLLMIVPALCIAGALLAAVVRPSLTSGGARTTLLLIGVAAAALLYGVTGLLHARWRASDIEYAQRLRASAGRRRFLTARLLERLGGRAEAAQLARDLRLTARGFSSAVYVSWTFAALWLVLFAVASATGLWPAGEALPPGSGDGGFLETTLLVPVVAAKAACVLASASLAAVVPVLVAHQLPHLWLERATRATGAELWRAKVWYARLVALPAPVAAWALAVVTGAVPPSYAAVLLAECVWLWWLVSSAAGVLAFEMPEQPGLSLVLMLFVGLSLGLLTAWLWPLGLTAGMAADQAAMRGVHRAHMLLRAEGD